VSNKSYLKNHLVPVLLTVLLTIISAGVSHAEIVEPTTYEECLSEHIKKAESNRAVKRMKAMCQDSFPQATKSELHKLSRGKTVNVICMSDQEEHVLLKIEPRRRKLMVNDAPGKLTKIKEGTFYGTATLDEGVLNVSVSAPTGRFNGTFKNKNGERTELSEMVCTEKQFSHSSPANQRKTSLLSM
jgi:hypothetical protein